MANQREKNEVDKKEGGMMNTHALSRLFPGMNREREMSAMVSALTHVVTGEVPKSTDSAFLHDNHAVTPHVPSSASTTPSNYVLGTSSHKRAREQDASCFSQTSSMPRSKNMFKSLPSSIFFYRCWVRVWNILTRYIIQVANVQTIREAE